MVNNYCHLRFNDSCYFVLIKQPQVCFQLCLVEEFAGGQSTIYSSRFVWLEVPLSCFNLEAESRSRLSLGLYLIKKIRQEFIEAYQEKLTSPFKMSCDDGECHICWSYHRLGCRLNLNIFITR